MKKIFFAVLFLSLFLFISQVQAKGLVPCGGPDEVPCRFCHFFVMFNNVVKFVMTILVPVIAVLMLVVGGVMFLFAGAKPEILIRAKGVITSTLWGLLIIFGAWVIVNTILDTSGIVDMEGWKWYQIDCQ